MAITYPLTPPDQLLEGARATLRAVTAVGVSKSPFTFVSQAQKYPGQFWGLEVTLRPMAREEVEPIIAFLLALNGPYGSFTYGPPLASDPMGVPSGTPVVKGADQTGGELLTDGWTPSAEGLLLAGDYIQLGTRLHKVLTDVDADGSGNATIDIWPNLRESPADNSTIITSDCVGVFRLAENSYSLWSADIERMHLTGFSAVEDI